MARVLLRCRTVVWWSMASVILKRGREDSLVRRHPWVFSGAIARIDGSPTSGETVEVLTSDGVVCGRGAYSPRSEITVRIWTFDPDEQVDETFFRARLARAIGARQPPQNEWGMAARRLVYAESDGLPGLIVDRYADYVVCQFLAAGAEYWKTTIVALLQDLAPNKGLYERSDVAVRDKEGLPKRSGVLAGEAPPDLLEIQEGPHRFLVDVKAGHKTGFYLDQRDNRPRAAEYMREAEVLDGFAYTGGFSVAALSAGAAHATVLDSSAGALALARRNLDLNGIDPSRSHTEEADAFTLLRQYRDRNRRFDAIVLDPPKFAGSGRSVERACRGYKDINLLACKLLRSGGVLVTFSCSQHVSADLFQKTIAYAALDAGREVQIIHWLRQASDHPTALHFPEAEYLKGLICRVW